MFWRRVGSDLRIGAIAHSAETRAGKLILVLTICDFEFIYLRKGQESREGQEPRKGQEPRE